MGAHGAVASKALGDEALVKAVLDDFETAPISEKLRAQLRFLKKATLAYDSLTTEDADALFSVGVSEQAAQDALYVAYIFAIHTRMADTLGYEIPDDGYRMAQTFLLKVGYR